MDDESGRTRAISRGARGVNPSQERAFGPGCARVSLAAESVRGCPSQQNSAREGRPLARESPGPKAPTVGHFLVIYASNYRFRRGR